MSSSKRHRILELRIDEETYNVLVKRSDEEGFSSLNDYILAIIKHYIRSGAETVSMDKFMSRLKRYVQDMVSAEFSVINTIRRQVMELYDKIDALTSRINEIENKVKELETKLRQQVPATRIERRGRKTGIERLREEKVLFESKLSRLKYRDKFFDYLKRMGAIIIPLRGERVAIDPDFWEEFKRKIFEELDTDNEDVIREKLSPLEYELFVRLRNEPLIFFDARTRKWKPISGLDIFK
jgi:vacuolar-type H+-ATPase subunit I/STV1